MRKLVIAAATGLLAVGATAYARSEINARSTEVSVKGLDRNDPADMAVLYGRIKEAAQRVCALPSEGWNPAANTDRLSCVKNAVAGAVARADSETLTALHESTLNTNRTITAAIR